MEDHKNYSMMLLLFVALSISAYCVVRDSPSNTAIKSIQSKTASDSERDSELGERIHLFEEKVSFKPPAEFIPLTEEQVRKNFKAVLPQGVYYGNKDVSAAIAFGYVEQKNIKSEQLPQIKAQMEKMLEALPSFSWVENGFIEINGVKWINLEGEYKDNKGKSIRNNMCFAIVEGRGLIGCSFASNKLNDYEKYNVVLRKSKDTIEIRK